MLLHQLLFHTNGHQPNVPLPRLFPSLVLCPQLTVVSCPSEFDLRRAVRDNILQVGFMRVCVCKCVCAHVCVCVCSLEGRACSAPFWIAVESQDRRGLSTHPALSHTQSYAAPTPTHPHAPSQTSSPPLHTYSLFSPPPSLVLSLAVAVPVYATWCPWGDSPPLLCRAHPGPCQVWFFI